VVLHATERARQREAEAAAQEAAAREGRDCRETLRERHIEYAEATADVVRVEGLARQADDLVDDLRRRHAEAAAALAAGDREAADRLAAAIADGVGRDGWPLAPRADQALTKQTELAGKLRTAEAARDRFDGELKAAKSKKTRSRRALELAALQTLVNAEADLARDIGQAEAALARRRDGLMNLRSLLDRERRRLGLYVPMRVAGPPVLDTPGAIDPAVDWSATFEALKTDPEIVFASDTPEEPAA
jgi:hypothetical protein